MGRDKDSIKCTARGKQEGKVKATHMSKEKQEISLLLPMCKQVFIPPQQTRAPLQVMVTWGDKYHHSKCPSLPLSVSMSCTQQDVLWCGKSLWPSGINQLTLWVSCPSSILSPASSLAECSEKQKRAWSCVSSVSNPDCIKISGNLITKSNGVWI